MWIYSFSSLENALKNLIYFFIKQNTENHFQYLEICWFDLEEFISNVNILDTDFISFRINEEKQTENGG